MMTREQVQTKIIEIDREINQIIADNPIRKAEARPIGFPTVTWIVAAVLGAVWQVGPQFLKSLVEQYVPIPPEAFFAYASYGAMGVGALALILTLRWLVFGRGATKGSYHAANERLKELRKQRQILEDQLKAG